MMHGQKNIKKIKDVVCRNTSFITENPISTTCFVCTKPSSGHMCQKIIQL